MRFVSIGVRNFKGLARAELADLAPDLNLVVGPNEAGKSRLILALRYALFERYKGESEDKKALRTHGSTESPVVEVTFEAAGTRWSLTKQFLKGAFAKLEGGGKTLTDDDAEQRLRELFGTRVIQGRREVDQFLGLWPLLWVKQGGAGVAPNADLNEDARARLRDVLASHVNEVAAGPLGERVVARAATERARYWTATWKETGELATARERHAEALTALATATAKRAAAHGEADELATITRDLAGLDARIVEQRARATESAARVAKALEIATRLRAQETDAARRRAEAELAERAVKEHDATAARGAEIGKRIADEQSALAPLAKARAEMVTRGAEIAARANEAHAALEAAHADHLRARRRVRLDEAARREREASERLTTAKAREARVSELRAALAEARIDEAQIQRVRKAGEALAKSSAALAASSAGVRIRAARDLVIDGAPLGEGEERAWTYDAPARIVIDGVGAIDVRPGGTDLDARRAKAQEARHALAGELERLGAASIDDAEARFATRTAVAAQLAHATPLLAEAAPDGVGSLEDDLRARTLERASIGELDDDARPIADAEARLAEATEASSRARADRDALQSELARTTDAIARHEASLAQLARDDNDARARLALLPPRGTLEAARTQAQAAWLESHELATALAEAHGKTDDASLASEQEARALERLLSERADKHARSLGLDALVRAHGGDDLHERVQRAEGDLDERAASLRAIEARALAARALVVALDDARRETQQRLVAPVVDRVRPYLETLLPGRRLRMDEDWRVLGLVEGDLEDDFEHLSTGAREQVSVLVRLAMAEVLGEREPLPIVLDDSFVNADRARMDGLMRVLYRASRKQQILLFSCHEAAFERLGESRRFALPAHASNASAHSPTLVG